MAKYLTKSRFKQACECPTKLFYTTNKEYGNNNNDDSFLKALAEGGFQVGELAKLYFEGGHEVKTLDYDAAISETEKLLTQDNVIIYEAAFRYDELFVRVDILVKTGKNIQLIEVKAKSFGSEEPSFFKKKSRELDSNFEPYLLDVAFQTHVAQMSHPNFIIKPFLMLADKHSVATVDGLNQLFFLQKKDGRTGAVVNSSANSSSLGEKVLRQIDVSVEIRFINKEYKKRGKTFSELIAHFSDIYKSGVLTLEGVGSKCKSCEFRIGQSLKDKGLKSGFEECWTNQLGLRKEDFKKPFAFEIWNSRKTDEFLLNDIVFMEQVKEEDLRPKTPGKESHGLNTYERQWLQVSKAQKNDTSSYLDKDGLYGVYSEFVYPLNFIDFETTMAAIPFNSGRSPYEQIAFQFSHHILSADGTVEHKTEYINRKRGKFPNFEFIRELKKALEKNSGTIFRYAVHENTVLCQIHEQLQNSAEKDRNELCTWIETITDKKGEWCGDRNMVDLCDLVKKYYFSPLTKGSNSIKKVLPAILNSSKFIQERYSKPVYGTQMKSRNYKDWVWIVKDGNGDVKDPYKLLPPVFSDFDLEEMDSLITDNSLADGGAAMTAYARMQFTEMTEMEADRVSQALLKYCELDTFAMVLIYEFWAHEIGWKKDRKAA